MRLDELEFDLPPGLIAATAAEPRDSARLLVVSRSDPTRLEHRTVRDLADLLDADDLLVTNDSRVVPARFRAINPQTQGKAQGLWLNDDGTDSAGNPIWTALIKARRHRAGRVLRLLNHEGEPSPITLEFLEPSTAEPGAWRLIAKDDSDPNTKTPQMLELVGLAPLPPYILNARRDAGLDRDRADDINRYQTVYAQHAGQSLNDPAAGSVAAPTAGLHFTPGLLDRLSQAGINRASVTLHVGTGTFKTVETDDLSDHPMHAEWCSIPSQTREQTQAAKRTIAVGTTAARTLEAFAQMPSPSAGWLETDLLIQPGHPWQAVDGLLTNFHLPRSTLLALVAALFPDGIDRVQAIYAEAIRERYRFFSFGDAMLILP